MSWTMIQVYYIMQQDVLSDGTVCKDWFIISGPHIDRDAALMIKPDNQYWADKSQNLFKVVELELAARDVEE